MHVKRPKISPGFKSNSKSISHPYRNIVCHAIIVKTIRLLVMRGASFLKRFFTLKSTSSYLSQAEKTLSTILCLYFFHDITPYFYMATQKNKNIKPYKICQQINNFSCIFALPTA